MIDREHESLWQGISEFALDDPTAKRTFSLRLRQENAWSEEFAARVICEYKRFAFLCLVADQPCVPSRFVDQVWHMHILNLHSYLFDFCRGVLGRMLWHRPSKGGIEEGERHHKLYGLTLDSYERCFGQAPPPDIWPRCVAVLHHEGQAMGVGEPFAAEIAELILDDGPR
jgi:hypothetical protein